VGRKKLLRKFCFDARTTTKKKNRNEKKKENRKTKSLLQSSSNATSSFDSPFFFFFAFDLAFVGVAKVPPFLFCFVFCCVVVFFFFPSAGLEMATEFTIKRQSTSQLKFLCAQQEAKEWIEAVLEKKLSTDLHVSIRFPCFLLSFFPFL
jgi:hypothetical protein